MRRGFGAVASFDLKNSILNFQIFALRDTATAPVWLKKKSFFRSFNSLGFLEFRDSVDAYLFQFMKKKKKKKEKRFHGKVN